MAYTSIIWEILKRKKKDLKITSKTRNPPNNYKFNISLNYIFFLFLIIKDNSLRITGLKQESKHIEQKNWTFISN